MELLGSLTVTDMLDRLGSKEPVPGGGAAAGVAGALSAALASMVVAYSLGRKSLAPHQDALAGTDRLLRDARGKFLELADRDAKAYAALSGLWGLAESDPKHQAEWGGAIELAIEVPTKIMEAGLELLACYEALVPICNQNLTSDLAGAAALAEACVKAAGQNVRVNAGLLKDDAQKQGILDDLVHRRGLAVARCAAVEKACGS